MSAAFIGLDLAKSVFQVHGVDAQGKVVVTKRLRRDAVLAFFANLAPCVVGMEACAGSHFWAREIARLGHTVRLMAPQDFRAKNGGRPSHQRRIKPALTTISHLQSHFLLLSPFPASIPISHCHASRLIHKISMAPEIGIALISRR